MQSPKRLCDGRSKGSYLLSLPKEILSLIFSFLQSEQGLSIIRSTCSYLCSILDSNFIKLSLILMRETLEGDQQYVYEERISLENICNFFKRTIRSCSNSLKVQLRDLHLEPTFSLGLPSVVSQLDLKGCRITDLHLSHFPTQLRSLKVELCERMDEQSIMRMCNRLLLLTKLIMKNTLLSNTEFQSFSLLSTLNTLKVSNNPSITSSLRYLPKSLLRLSLRGTYFDNISNLTTNIERLSCHTLIPSINLPKLCALTIYSNVANISTRTTVTEIRVHNTMEIFSYPTSLLTISTVRTSDITSILTVDYNQLPRSLRTIQQIKFTDGQFLENLPRSLESLGLVWRSSQNHLNGLPVGLTCIGIWEDQPSVSPFPFSRLPRLDLLLIYKLGNSSNFWTEEILSSLHIRRIEFDRMTLDLGYLLKTSFIRSLRIVSASNINQMSSISTIGSMELEKFSKKVVILLRGKRWRYEHRLMMTE